MWLGSRIIVFSENILSFPSNFFLSTYMNLSRIIISRVFLKISFVASPSKSCKLWSINTTIAWSIVIWSQRIFFLSRRISQASRLSITAQVASWVREYIPISNPGSTELLRLFWVFHIQQLLICGALGLLLPNYILDFLYSLVKVRLNS